VPIATVFATLLYSPILTGLPEANQDMQRKKAVNNGVLRVLMFQVKNKILSRLPGKITERVFERINFERLFH
jgi:hypothetical protein